jgi:small basic protein
MGFISIEIFLVSLVYDVLLAVNFKFISRQLNYDLSGCNL